MEKIQIILIILGVILFIPAIYISIANNNATHQPYPIYVSALVLVIIGAVNPSFLKFKAGENELELRSYSNEELYKITNQCNTTDKTILESTKEKFDILVIEAEEAKEKIPEDYLILAKKASEEKDYNKALENVFRGLSFDIKDNKLKSILTYRLANIYHHMDNIKMAEIKYKESLSLNKSYPCTYNNLGSIYYTTKRNKEAEDAYKKSIKIDDKFSRAYFNLGILYKETNRYDEAEKSYKKAIQINEKYANAHNNLGSLYMMKDRNIEAEDAYKKAIDIDDKHLYAYFNLGDLYKKTNRNIEAENFYKKAIDIDYKFASAHHNLGILYEKMGKKDKAKEHLDIAEKLETEQSK